MRIRHLAAASLACLALAGCSSTKLWMKPGGSAIEAENEEMDCAAQSEGGSITIGQDGGTGGPTPVDSFSKRYGCLRSRGYKLVTITSEEDAKLKSLSGMEKDAYYSELMSKYGIPAPQSHATETSAPPPAGVQRNAPRGGGQGDLPPGVSAPRR